MVNPFMTPRQVAWMVTLCVLLGVLVWVGRGGLDIQPSSPSAPVDFQQQETTPQVVALDTEVVDGEEVGRPFLWLVILGRGGVGVVLGRRHGFISSVGLALGGNELVPVDTYANQQFESFRLQTRSSLVFSSTEQAARVTAVSHGTGVCARARVYFPPYQKPLTIHTHLCVYVRLGSADKHHLTLGCIRRRRYRRVV